MALYAGLSPAEALIKWHAIRQKANFGPNGWDHSALTPEENADISGNMVGLAKENPGAWAAVKNGIEDPTDSDYFYEFNQSTGQFDRKEHHGYWSHPESWMQLGFGAALGGVGLFGPGGLLAGSGGAAPVAGGGAAGGAAGGGAAGGGAAGGAAGGAGGAAGTTGSILGTAGTVGKILSTAKALSPVLSGAAAGANQSQQANDLAKLREAQLALEAPQQRLKNSVAASITANAKPVQITTSPSPFAHAPAGSNMIHYTNSLSPADISPETRQLAQSIIAQQLAEQMSPNHGLPDVGQGSTAGNILGGAALGAGVLGSLGTLGSNVRSGQGATISPIDVNPGDFNDPGLLYDPANDFIDPGVL
jgi:hypothetical protein